MRSSNHRNGKIRGGVMRKALTALLAAAAVGAAALPTSAEARWGWVWGGFGVGLAAGAIIGGALARPYYPYYGYGYGDGYGYPYAYGYGYPAYYGGIILDMPPTTGAHATTAIRTAAATGGI